MIKNQMIRISILACLSNMGLMMSFEEETVLDFISGFLQDDGCYDVATVQQELFAYVEKGVIGLDSKNRYYII